MFGQIDEIKNLAFKYSKEQLGRMAQMGMIDPQKAMLAGMMRDRVSKEDSKPPTTTVAQDVLAPQQQQPQMGMQQPQQPQPQQMGMPPQAAPQAPVQMAATGGITSLPVHEQDYAGGGIVAFADGGDTDDGVARFGVGGTADLMRQQVMDEYGLFAERATPEQITAAQNKQQLQQRAEQLKSEMLYGRPNDATKTEYANIVKQLNQPAVVPAPNQTDAETARLARQNSSTTNPFYTPPAPAPAPKVDKPAANKSANVGGPRLPALTEPSGKIEVEKYNPKPVQELDEITKEQREAYIKAGYDPDMYKKFGEKDEAKRKDFGTRKEQAKGEFLMNLGVGLMGAKRGREFEALGAGAKEGLASFKDAMKDVRAAEEKLDERLRTYEIADNQAKKTGTDAAIAKRDSQRALAEAAESKFVDAKNAARAEEAKVQANLFGTKMQADTSRYVAQLQAATQRDYTAALKAQGLDVQRQKVLIDAAGDYIAKNADKPAYLDKPDLLQAHAIAFSKRLAAEMGVTIPGGGTQTIAPAPTKDFYKKTYGIDLTGG